MSNPTTLFGRLFLGLIILALQIDVSLATSIRGSSQDFERIIS